MFVSKYLSKYQFELILISVLAIVVTSIGIATHNEYSCSNGTYLDLKPLADPTSQEHKCLVSGMKNPALSLHYLEDVTNKCGLTKCNGTTFGYIFNIIVLSISCLILVLFPIMKMFPNLLKF